MADVMCDARWPRLAAQLCDTHSVSIGTRVSITVTGAEALPAADAFVDEIHRRGGVPQVVLVDERHDRMAMRHATLEALRQPGAVELAALDWCDVHIALRAMVPPGDDPIDERRLAAQRVGKGLVAAARWKASSWVLVRVPTQGWADLIGVDLGTLLDEFFTGSFGPWDVLEARHTALCRRLEGVAEIRIIDEGTDLTLGVAGRTWIGFAGEANIPDGEVATAPREDQVDGFVTFPGRFWFAGACFDELRLEFDAGRVVEVGARRGAEIARALVATDSGSDRVGELGIGTSRHVRTMTGDLLIDEKILGTAHLALGRAYPACGGTVESSLHWDIIVDLRGPGGNLLADGVPLIEAGTPVGDLAAFS